MKMKNLKLLSSFLISLVYIKDRFFSFWRSSVDILEMLLVYNNDVFIELL